MNVPGARPAALPRVGLTDKEAGRAGRARAPPASTGEGASNKNRTRARGKTQPGPPTLAGRAIPDPQTQPAHAALTNCISRSLLRRISPANSEFPGNLREFRKIIPGKTPPKVLAFAISLSGSRISRENSGGIPPRERISARSYSPATSRLSNLALAGRTSREITSYTNESCKPRPATRPARSRPQRAAMASRSRGSVWL